MIRHPLFILAAPRSFTSLLCAMIGQHPQAYGVPELNLFLADTLGEFVRSRTGSSSFQLHGIMRTIAQLYTGEQTLDSIITAKRFYIEHQDSYSGDFYTELCRQVFPQQVVDKSPAYSFNYNALERMNQTFPESRFLYITRHPRAQGNSMMKIADGKMTILFNAIDYSTDPPTLDPQYAWVKIQRTILEFLKTIPESRKKHLQGEDIMENPKLYFKEISEWMGWDNDEASLECMLQPQNSPYACLGPYGAPLGNDPNFLHSPIFKSRPRASTGSLDGPLDWRQDKKGFIPDVITIARQLGYE